MIVADNTYDPTVFQSAIEEVHEFLVAQIQAELDKAYSDADLRTNLTAFLTGLCKPDDTDKARLYQSHRLAINIAIDLASQTQSASAYVRLLKNVAFDQMVSEAHDLHQLFAQASTHSDAKPAWYSEQGSRSYDKEPVRQYVRVVSLYNYLKYYTRSSTPVGTFDGAIQRDHTRLLGSLLRRQYIDTGKPIPFKTIQLQYKEFTLSGGPPQYFLWVLPIDDFDQAKACSGDKCSACDAVVITTGRPVTTDETLPLAANYQVCVVLPDQLSQPSYQPTAINADWMGGGYPYLSYRRFDGFGRTFNLWTGRHDGNEHIPQFEASERVMAPFDPVAETGSFYARSLNCPTQVSEASYNEVIRVATRRFQEAIRY